MKKDSYPFRRQKKLWGFIDYKPRWGLTLQGWTVILLSTALLFLLVLPNVGSFLAYSAPVNNANVLLVEGWVDDPVIQGAVAEFERGNYNLVITTGGSIGRGAYIGKYKNYAQLAAATLVAFGLDKNKIAIIPTPDVAKDRTAAGAIAIKEWIPSSNIQIKAINIYSSDVHTRRSWMLYKEVLEPEVKVGAIANPPIAYDLKSWWTTSEGMRRVFSETLAYIYAKFLWKA